MGIHESKFTSDKGIMTLKHISFGNWVWMPVNYEKKISGHDDDDEKKDTYIRALPLLEQGSCNFQTSNLKHDLINIA